MYLPLAVFVPPVWFGALSGGAMISAGHLLMPPTMLALMPWRRNEHGHGGHSPSWAPSSGSGTGGNMSDLSEATAGGFKPLRLAEDFRRVLAGNGCPH
jgi:hypothetical protein